MSHPNIVIDGSTYNAVPRIDIPDDNGGTASFYDTSEATGSAEHLLSGYTMFGAEGEENGAIPAKSAADLTVSGDTVTAPAGYYADTASKSVASGSAATPETTITANPTISVNNSTGVITATASATQNITPTVNAGYVLAGTAGTVTVSGSATEQLSVQAAATITPSTSQQTAVAAGKYTTGAVVVSAMPAGTAGTPTATKGTVSNNSVSVTPSVTNSAGYISSGTVTGTAVSVAASELVSGSQTITQNGTVDVTNLAEVVVNVAGGGGSSSSYTLLATQEYAVNTTSSTTTNLSPTIQLGSAAWTKDKIVYVRVRDKAGARNGYMLGTDNWLVNYQKANNSSTALSYGVRITHYVSSTGKYGQHVGTLSTPYGVFPRSISSSGELTLGSRYNSGNTQTINGTYLVEVYTLDYPDGVSPYDI